MRAAVAALSGAGRTGREVELVGAPGSGRRTLLAQLAIAVGGAPRDHVRRRSAYERCEPRSCSTPSPIWIADGGEVVSADAGAGAVTLVARRAPASPPLAAGWFG